MWHVQQILAALTVRNLSHCPKKAPINFYETGYLLLYAVNQLSASKLKRGYGHDKCDEYGTYFGPPGFIIFMRRNMWKNINGFVVHKIKLVNMECCFSHTWHGTFLSIITQPSLFTCLPK